MNARLRERKVDCISMDRFRPNIVVKGVSRPFAEDCWAKVRIGNEALFRVSKPCARCTMPTVDQATGKRSKQDEPTKTMREFRLFNWVKPRKKEVFFGQNLVQLQQEGSIRVGDAVKVLCGSAGMGAQSSAYTKMMVAVSDLFGLFLP